MVMDFIAYPSLNGQNLLIEDKSTGLEEGMARKITIKDSTGFVREFDFPIVSGLGDIFSFPLDKDKAFQIGLVVNGSLFSRNVAIIYRAGRYIDFKIAQIAKSGITAVSQLSATELKNYMWREQLVFAIENYTAVGDLTMAQNVIETLNKICEDVKD